MTDAVLDQDRGGLRERVSGSTFLSDPIEFPSRGKVKENGTGMKAVCVCVSHFFALFPPGGGDKRYI